MHLGRAPRRVGPAGVHPPVCVIGRPPNSSLSPASQPISLSLSHTSPPSPLPLLARHHALRPALSPSHVRQRHPPAQDPSPGLDRRLGRRRPLAQPAPGQGREALAHVPVSVPLASTSRCWSPPGLTGAYIPLARSHRPARPRRHRFLGVLHLVRRALSLPPAPGRLADTPLDSFSGASRSSRPRSAAGGTSSRARRPSRRPSPTCVPLVPLPALLQPTFPSNLTRLTWTPSFAARRSRRPRPPRRSSRARSRPATPARATLSRRRSLSSPARSASSASCLHFLPPPSRSPLTHLSLRPPRCAFPRAPQAPPADRGHRPAPLARARLRDRQRDPLRPLRGGRARGRRGEARRRAPRRRHGCRCWRRWRRWEPRRCAR